MNIVQIDDSSIVIAIKVVPLSNVRAHSPFSQRLQLIEYKYIFVSPEYLKMVLLTKSIKCAISLTLLLIHVDKMLSCTLLTRAHFVSSLIFGVV